jgi:DNA-binding CsgD family transcriptional regulator
MRSTDFYGGLGNHFMPDVIKGSGNFQRISKATEISEVIEAMFASCQMVGGDKLIYNSETMFEGAASAQSIYFAMGFPPEWMEIYNAGGGKAIEPVPEIVLQAGRVMTWREAAKKLTLTDRERALLKQAEQLGLLNGLGFPLWGPKGQNAFVAIGFPENRAELKPEVIQAEHLLLQAGHIKIVELSTGKAASAILSQREREVLTWIGKGKSNTDIATILSISPETVATYKRRIYAKLDCHDRIGAVVKALQLRLIRL